MIEDLMTREELEALMDGDGGVAIINFWSPTCGPCRAMAPHFEQIANDFEDEPIRFVKINTAAQAALAQPFKIHSVPTLLFVNNGEILDVRVGALPGASLTKKAQWLLRKARGEGLFSSLFGRSRA